MKKSEAKISVTFRQVLDSGNWLYMCEKYGINEWCLNEGMASDTDTVEITLEDAEKWGLIED